MSPKLVLDPCCGSRMFWFDKNNPIAVFADNRVLKCESIWKSGDGLSARHCTVNPDVVADFRNLPFEDESFWHIVFDPPHLIHVGENAWMVKKYGRLPKDFAPYLKAGFDECWRVLKTNGTIVFKWNEVDIRVSEIIKCIGRNPLYGHKSGRLSKTHWMVFFKEASEMGNDMICNNCPEYPHGCSDCIKTERERREDGYRETVADAERDEEGVLDER